MAVSGALPHGVVDLVAAVLQLHREESAPDGDDTTVCAALLLLIGDGESGAFGTGVDA